MPLKEFTTHVRNYLLIGFVLVGTWFFSAPFARAMNRVLSNGQEHGDMLLLLSSITIIFTLGYLAYELAKPTIIPSFVLAIFVGMAARDVFGYLTGNPELLSMLITAGAVMILFGGGLETPFHQFRKSLGPILSLALIGTIINAFLFSLVLAGLRTTFGVHIPLPAILLLGAAIASTDPAAIIPSFQTLFFTKPRVKHIAVSESAINDVVSAVLVGIFLTIFAGGDIPISVPEAYIWLLEGDALTLIVHTVSVGIFVGFIGFLLFTVWSKWKAKVQIDAGSDAALFLAIPLLSYTVATAFGGSGLLATFLTGLLLQIRSNFRHVEHYFNHTIEGFLKPMMFMLLGAMVPPAELLEVARIGIVSGFIFMFALRPIIVSICLVPFMCTRKCLKLPELIFLSFVRETGVIPAALLISIYVSGVPGAETIMAIGLWVILLTLIIEPPLTPWLAKTLHLAEEKDIHQAPQHSGPVAVLCSRGYSFPERMETVVEWAQQHAVENVVLLHCPEEKYSKKFVAEVKVRANEVFAEMNTQLQAKGQHQLTFEILAGPGSLQENIEALIESGDVAIIFVGAKMLDYRIDEVKRLDVPFYFMQ